MKKYFKSFIELLEKKTIYVRIMSLFLICLLLISELLIGSRMVEPENMNYEVQKIATPASADIEDDYMTVTIYYKIEQKGQEIDIFEPYIAKLHKGSSFQATVHSPVYPGYTPVYNRDGDEYEAAGDVTLDYSDLQQNEEIYIWYRPVKVPYTSRYFLQNVLNDEYTEDTTKRLTGEELTGEYPSETIDIEIPGFTALFHQPETVAADGSTEFKCYYDRNYYLYNFDCNGGHGVESVYAKYGTSLVVNNPVRQGYVFAGWDKMDDEGGYDGVADELPESIGIGNETYKALWKVADTTYTVIYWVQNAVDDEYSYVTSCTYEGTSEMKIKRRDLDDYILSSDESAPTYYSNARYIEYDEEKTTSINRFIDGEEDGIPIRYISVEGDGSTTINVAYKRKEYTLKFYYAKQNSSGEYKIVGGSTWPFAYINKTNDYISEMLENVPESNWGTVSGCPGFNDKGQERGYTTGEETYNGTTYYYISFKARYGSDISGKWPIDIFNPIKTTTTYTNGDTAYFSAWNVEHHTYYSSEHDNKTLKGNYIYLDYQLLYDYSKYEDSDTVCFLAFWENGANIGWSKANQWTYNTYLPVFDGDEYDKTYNGKNYKLFDSCIIYDDNTDQNPESQTATGIKGFTNFDRQATANGALDKYRNSYTVDFYYKRNNYTLNFYNYSSVIEDKSQEVPYESALAAYKFVPEYPENLEKGAYEFAGWYTSPYFSEGTEVDWESITMPALDLTVYAYWKPVKHEVTFSNTYGELSDGMYVAKNSISHGEYLPTGDIPVPDSSSLGEEAYVFQGWFYIDEITGEKKCFNAGEMPISKNLHLFAEWKSSEVVPYKIHYQYQDASGEVHTISTDTEGYAYLGMTKTFVAKAGTELSDGYQKGYYPKTNSHSILMRNDSKANEYTFEYVYKESVNYTVKYVDRSTGMELKPAKTVHTKDAVITEKFEPVKNYVSDAFYKKLVLSADEAQNVIVFYYTKNSENAIYTVRHMVQQTDGTYTEYASIEGIGSIGSNLPVQKHLDIMGFDYNEQKTLEENDEDITVSSEGVTGTIGANGLELCMYYDRKEYSYTIHYLEYGTEVKLQDSVTGRGDYESTIAIDIPDKITTEDGKRYSLTDHYDKQIVIRDDTVINIYYKATSVVIHYIPVCKDKSAEQFGSVSIVSERVKSLQNIVGSIPKASEGYNFLGWYTDEACEIPVSPDWVTVSTGQIVPKDFSVENYYALFEPISTSLTLKEQTGGSYGNKEDKFTFTITLHDKEGNVMTGEIPVKADAVDGVLPPDCTRLIFDNQGQANIKLKHGQSVEIEIPTGCSYTIEETVINGYDTAIDAVSAGVSDAKVAGSNRVEGTVYKTSITYTNVRNGVPTGIRIDIFPYMLLIGFALLTGILFLRSSFRKNVIGGGACGRR